MERQQTMRVMFDVRYIEDSQELLTQRDFIEALRDGLADEWWSSDRGAEWYVAAMYGLEEDGSLTPSDARLKSEYRQGLKDRVNTTLNDLTRMGVIGTDAADEIEERIGWAIESAPLSQEWEHTMRGPKTPYAEKVERMIHEILNALVTGGYGEVIGVASQGQIEDLQYLFEKTDTEFTALGRIIGEITSNQDPD